MGLKGVVNYPANLSCPGFAGYATHLIEQCSGLRQPMTSKEFA